MRNVINVLDEVGKTIEVEILVEFKIEKIGKEYIAYTFDGNALTEEIEVFISEIDYKNGVPQIVAIPEDEKEMVLLFYDSIRKSI